MIRKMENNAPRETLLSCTKMVPVGAETNCIMEMGVTYEQAKHVLDAIGWKTERNSDLKVRDYYIIKRRLDNGIAFEDAIKLEKD